MRLIKLGGLCILILMATCCYGAPDSNPHVNATNGLIAFTLKDIAGKQQIYTQNPDGTNRKQLTYEGDNGRPDWSPDGNKLVFGYGGNGKRGIALMDADGTHRQFLAEGTMDPDWSPDGKVIAFSRPTVEDDGQGRSQIWLIDPDGKHLRQLTKSNLSKNGPSWSPDGKQMVFICYRNPNSPSNPKPQIGIMNSDGTNDRLLTNEDRMNVRVETDGTKTLLETAHDANAPSWSPVDDRITFWSGLETQYGQVWVINADGSGNKQLTEDPSHRSSDDPSWSPDGTKILFNTGRSGKSELWVMDANGDNEKKVSDIDPIPCPGRGAWQPVIEGVTKQWTVHKPTASEMKEPPLGVEKVGPDVPPITRTGAKGVFVLSGYTLIKLDSVTLKQINSIRLIQKGSPDSEGLMTVVANRVLVVVGNRFFSVDATTLKVTAQATLPETATDELPQPQTMVVNGNTVYVISGNRVAAINMTNGKLMVTNLQNKLKR